MKYVSIDLETTGLDPDNCQILEIAAVFNNDELPLALCPIFHRYIWHPIIKGEHYALQMNAHIIKEIHDANAKGAKADVLVNAGSLQYQLADWLAAQGYERPEGKPVKSVVPAGKNFAGFDVRFLRRYEVDRFVTFKHRVIDPAGYYHLVTDECPPDTNLCLKRAGLEGSVQHRAVDDAKDVIRLVRTHFGVPL